MAAIAGHLTGVAGARAGTWTPLIRLAPGGVSHIVLLTDGTVMAQHANSEVEWYRLTPDSSGSYVNGTWSTLASMNDTRLYYSTQVLRDGRVLVAGGEYGTGKARAEVYNPLTDAWTLRLPPISVIDPATEYFSDSISKTLPDGRILIGPVRPSASTVIFNPVGDSWSVGPSCNGSHNEVSWVKLPDDSILSIIKSSQNAERFIPSLNAWIEDASLPQPLYDNFAEIGAGMLLADSRVIFFGGNGNTAIYTPSGTTANGSWVNGPDIPGGLAAPDAPAAMMVNGRILCAFGPKLYINPNDPTDVVFPPPTSFYEYNPTANTFTSISGPTGPTHNAIPYETEFLDLPDGSVLFSERGARLYTYRPTGAPLAAGKPTINSILAGAGGKFHLTGTKLNGISEGASYGDDSQMDSNWPLIRLTSGDGTVYYGRTFNWSSTGVQTGNRVVSTDFTVPLNLPAGNYSLVVVANGIASDAVTFRGPTWVDFDYPGPFYFGTFSFPFPNLAQGVAGVPSSGTIIFRDSGNSAETMTITKPMTLISRGSSVIIGR